MPEERRADSELREVLDRVADRAGAVGGEQGALRALRSLGVNTEDPIEAQKDFAFLRATRERYDAFYNNLFKNAIAALTKLLLLALAVGLLALLGFKPEAVKALFGGLL